MDHHLGSTFTGTDWTRLPAVHSCNSWFFPQDKSATILLNFPVNDVLESR